MKILRFLPLVMLVGCASEPKPVITHMVNDVPGTILPTEGTESVRYSENIKAYNVGRYVDPNNRLMMHEAHPIYRVETTGKWNLHPNPPVQISQGPAAQVVDAAHKDAPTTPEIIAEVNRQKVATKTVIEQGERLNQTLSKLSTALSESRQMGEQNQKLQKELDFTKERLDALEADFRNKQKEPPAPQATEENKSW